MHIQSSLLVLLILALVLGARPPLAHAIVISFAEPVAETGNVAVNVQGAGPCPPAPCVLQVVGGVEFGQVDFLVPQGFFPIPGQGGIATGLLLENVQPRGPISDRVTLELLPGPIGFEQITVLFESDSPGNDLGNAHPLEIELSVVESGSSPRLDRNGFFDLTFFVVPEPVPLPTPFPLPAGTRILVKSDIEEVPQPVSLLLIGSALAILGTVARRRRSRD